MIEKTEPLQRLQAVVTEIQDFRKKSPPGKTPKENDLKSLIIVLQKFNKNNENIDPALLEFKKFDLTEDVDKNIKEAIAEVEVFQRMNPPVKTKDMEKVIVALFAELGEELDAFHYNVKNLSEKWKKIANTVQKTRKSEN